MTSPRSLLNRAPRFGLRRMTPHVCVVDEKRHVRAFLIETLRDMGFVAHDCADVAAIKAAAARAPIDLVIVGVSAEGESSLSLLHELADMHFSGHVLLMGARHSIALHAAQQCGELLPLTMLSSLGTPFRSGELEQRIAPLRPTRPLPQAPVDIAEALENDWLELWYQPKIDPHSLVPHSAEALIRMRHPAWGIVLPSYFIPAAGDPQFRALSEFVVTRAASDWLRFAEDRIPIELAINLPVAVLQDAGFVDLLYRKLPRHPTFESFVVEVNGTEVIRDLPLAREIAHRLTLCSIGISIDNVGAQWSSLAGLHDVPFVEIKVDRTFVHGCAKDRLKRAMCATIVDLAKQLGIRTVAEGVETQEDFVTVRDMGFDLVQGFLFAKPMEAKAFARTLRKRQVPIMP